MDSKVVQNGHLNGHKTVYKKEREIYAMVPYFHNALILGDSVSESILDYRLLRKNNVVAKRGRCVNQIDNDMLLAIQLQPSFIFMEYGKNDMIYFQGNEEAFIEAYVRQIKRLRQALPEVSIYINSIIPMRHDIMETRGGLQTFHRFNDALKTMCLVNDVGFIDNIALMNWDDEVYEYDGIHPKYPYYVKWLKHMIQLAGLSVNGGDMKKRECM